MTGKNKRTAGGYRNGNSQVDSGRWISNNRSSSYGFSNESSAERGGYQGSPWMQNGSEGAFGYGSLRDNYGISDRYGISTSQSFARKPFDDDYTPERNSYNFSDRSYNPVASGFAGASSLSQESYKDPESILMELGKCYLSTLSNGGVPPGSQGASGYDNYSRDNYRYGGEYRKSNSSPRTRDFQGQGWTKSGQVKRSNSGQVKRRWESSGSNTAGGSGNNNNRKNPRLNSAKQSDKAHAKQSSAKPQVNGNQSSNKTQVNGKANREQVTNVPQAKDTNKSGETTKKVNNRPKRGLSARLAKKRGLNAEVYQKRKPNTRKNTIKAEGTNGEQKSKPSETGVKNSTKNRLTKRYNKVKENKFLDDNSRVLVSYLRQALEDIYPEHRMHSVLVSYYLIKHRNAVQLYQYELKTSLDKKFGAETNEETKKTKQNYLIEQKSKVLEELKIVNEEKNNEEINGQLIDECIELLIKDEYPAELIPQDEDYIEDTDVSKTLENLTHEFQYKFLAFVYDQFGYNLPEKQGTLEQELKFHLNNSIIPTLLVELAKSDTRRLGDKIDLPDILAKRLVRRTYNSSYLRHKSENFNRAIIRHQVAQKQHLQTSVLDLLPPGTNWSTKFIRDFSEVILMFDNIATVAKLKLIDYTPFINLTKEVKQGIFNELTNSVYKEAMELLKNDVPLRDRIFEKMEGVTDDETENIKATCNEAMDTN